MQARVRKGSRIIVVTAFTGREYVQHEFRLVPEGCEEEASIHPYLEVDEDLIGMEQKALGGAARDLAPTSAPQDKNDGGEGDVPTLSPPSIKEPETDNGDEKQIEDNKCLAFTKSGTRCKRNAGEHGYCSIHARGETN